MKRLRATDVIEEQVAKVEITRYESLPFPLKVTFLVASTGAIGLALVYVFGISIGGRVLLMFPYYWLFMGLVFACGFLILPARKKDKAFVPWYDLVAAISVFGISMYFYTNAWSMFVEGWNMPPLGFVLGVFILEGARRMGGPIFAGICALAMLFPLFAGYMPGIFWGVTLSLEEVGALLFFTQEGILGTLTKISADFIVGFLVFAGFLMATGAGDFFLKFASSLLGSRRGGPAKVAVVASGFFGSLSGSSLANVATTGAVTIPAMKRLGYPPHYAAAIEAVASTGGMFMPPVMGALAFIMAEITGIPYGTIIVGAVIPATLYYFGLLVQVDAYAARSGLKGLPKEEIPDMKEVLKDGWPYIFILVFLVWGLVYMRWERLAPWYATGIMVLISFTSSKTRLNLKRAINCFAVAGKLLVQTSVLLIPAGFLYFGANVTGVAGSFAAGILNLGAGNIALILALGISVAYLFGMAGMSVPAYIFLAITFAPTMVKLAGVEVLAIHLLILYYSMLSSITLPVAITSFLAATMAGASLTKTGLLSMRLGVVIYFIPLFFLFEPSLILQGNVSKLLYLLPLVFMGVALIAAGFEGYLLKVGVLKLWARVPIIAAGFLIALPETNTTVIGAVVALLVIAAVVWSNKKLKNV